MENCKMFNLMLSLDIIKKIKKEAYEKDTSASNVVRKILEDYYKKK